MNSLPLALMLLGCEPKASPPPPSDAPAPAESVPDPDSLNPPPADAEEFVLVGTVTSIVMQNINKAQGKFTYNVSLQVKVASVTPARDAQGPVTVRVDKLYWSQLPKEEASKYAPEGPHQTLNPLKYGKYEVGKDVELKVRFSSPGLAHLL